MLSSCNDSVSVCAGFDAEYEQVECIRPCLSSCQCEDAENIVASMDLFDNASIENQMCLDANDICEVVSDYELSPCFNSDNRDVHELDAVEPNSLELDMIKSALFEADPISVSSFLFSLDTCERDVCSTSCLTTDRYSPTLHALYFHFSNSCIDHISSFSSLDGLGKSLFDDFAGLYEEMNTERQAESEDNLFGSKLNLPAHDLEVGKYAPTKLDASNVQLGGLQVVSLNRKDNFRSEPHDSGSHILDLTKSTWPCTCLNCDDFHG